MNGAILPSTFFAVWLIGSVFSFWNSYVVPAPSEIFISACQLIVNGTLVKHIFVSMCRVFGGFLAAFLLAFPLGVALGMERKYLNFFQATLEFMRHVPPLAALPMLILWFGIGELPKLFIVLLATFFPIFLNTLHGVTACDPKLIEVGKSFGFNHGKIFQRILLPAALPSVLVGMRLGLGYSWRALVGAELIAASSGIGYMILDAEQLARPDVVVVGIITIGMIGSVIDWVFFRLTRKILPWQNGEDVSYGRG